MNTPINKTITEVEIGNIRLALIILTMIQVAFYILMFLENEIVVEMSYLNWGLVVINYALAFVCLWYNWKRFPLEKKKKTDNTWMILFLGFIGMWFWLPSKREIEKMNRKLHARNDIAE